MSAEENDLTAQVLSWMSKRGYPLEMKVTHELRKHRPDLLQQSYYYEDAFTEELREADVVTSWSPSTANGDNNRRVTFTAVIECKASGAPWVVFTQRSRPTWGTWRVGERTVLTLGERFPVRDIFQRHGTQSSPLFSMARNLEPGHGLTQKRDDRGGKDWAYDAVRQVISAAHGIARDFEVHGSGDPVTIVMPLVVTDSPLFECYVDADGEVAAESVLRSSVLMRTQHSRRSTYVRIVNSADLPALAKDLARCAASLTMAAPLPES